MNPRSWLPAAFSLLLVAADDPPPAPTPVPSDPVFHALLTDGTTVSGRLAQLGPDGKVVLSAEKGERAIPLDQLVKLSREGDPPAFPPEGSLVVFPEGDRLRAILGASDERTIETHPRCLGDAAVRVPLDSLLGLILAPPAESDRVEALLARVRDEPRPADVLWLANGDRQAGGFLSLDAQKVKFQQDAGPAERDRSRVLAIGFDPGQVVYPRPKGTFLEVTLSDGSRLGLSDTRLEKGHLAAATRFGLAVRLPIGEVARVHVRGASVVYLSESTPAGRVYVGYLGRHPETFGRDASIAGHAIRLGGQPFDRGLGTRPRTLLAYRLEPGDRRFQALVGLDDRAGPLGNVVFRVLVDGQERYASPPVSPKDAPRPLDVDVSGGKLLILATEFGERGDVQDDADWAEARLIR